MPDDIRVQVRKFIEDNYLFGEASTSLNDTASLRDAGLIDSTGILELVTFLESTFHIQMQDAEITPDNLDSIDAITSYVSTKRAETIDASSRTSEAKLDS